MKATCVRTAVDAAPIRKRSLDVDKLVHAQQCLAEIGPGHARGVGLSGSGVVRGLSYQKLAGKTQFFRIWLPAKRPRVSRRHKLVVGQSGEAVGETVRALPGL